MASAQDEAFALLACRRGVLTPEAVERARTTLRRQGLDEPIANVLVQERLLDPTRVSEILRELARGTYQCTACQEQFAYDALAALASLMCRCGGKLAPVASRRTGAYPAASPGTSHPSGGYPAVSPGTSHPSGGYPAVSPATSHPSGGFAAVKPGTSHPSGAFPGVNAPGTSHPSGFGPPAGWDARDTVIEKRQGGSDRHAAETVREKADPSAKKKKERTFGQYVLHKELGRGSNGVVFLATRKGLERRFALKVMLEEFNDDEEGIKRFHLEAAIASKLQDPGIIAVYDVGRIDNHYYYAMEYCPGDTLYARIKRGPLDPLEAADLIRQLARSISVAHAQGVLHRDLKPANIILEERTDRPRITDFGLARDRSLAASMTQEGDILGTPYYMAPEQLQGKKDLDHRVDLYALGVILYECLTGKRPFRAKTPMLLADKIMDGDAVPPRELEPGVSKQLEAICLRAMAVDPRDRYQTVDELAEQLDGLLLASGHRRKKRNKKKRAPGEGPSRRSLILVGAAVCFLVLAVGVGWIVHSSNQRKARIADVSETLARVLELPKQGAPVPFAQMRKELERIQPLAEEDQAAAVRRALELTSGWERLEAVRAKSRAAAEDYAGQRAGLWRARERAGEDPLLLAAIKDQEQRITAQEGLASAIRAAREPVAYRQEVIAAFDRALRAARGEELRRRIQLARVEYLLRRGRYDQVIERTPALQEGKGPIALRANLILAIALHDDGRREREGEVRQLFMKVWTEDRQGPVGLTGGAFYSLGKKDPGGALELAKRALSKAPFDPYAGNARVISLVTLGRHREALEVAEAQARRWPDEASVIWHQAVARFQSRAYDKAIAALTALNALLEPKPWVRSISLLGKSYLNGNQVGLAHQVLDRGLALYPNNIELQILKGLGYRGQRDYRSARRVLGAAYRQDRVAFEQLLRRMLGARASRALIARLTRPGRGPQDQPPPQREIVLTMGTISPATQALLAQRANKAPPAARPSLLKGLQGAALGKTWVVVKPHFDAARQAAPTSSVVALERARVLVGRDVYDAASEAIKQARRLPGASTHELDRLDAEILRRRGSAAAALGRYRALAKADPQGVEGICAKGEACLLEKRWEEGLAAADAALRLDPTHVASMILRAVLLSVRRPVDSLKESAKAYELEGAFSSRLMLAYMVGRIQTTLAGFMRGNFRSGMRGMQLLRETQALFAMTNGAGPRLVLAERVLVLDIPFPAPMLWEWTKTTLADAQRKEPKRGYTYVLLGVLAIRRGGGQSDVNRFWRKAKRLDKTIDLTEWAKIYRQKLGDSAQLKRLLAKD